jgi:hypothetical protein
MAAVLSTPHFTLLFATTSLPDPAVPFYHASQPAQNGGYKTCINGRSKIWKK